MMWKHKKMFKGKKFKGSYVFPKRGPRKLILTCGKLKKEFKSSYHASEEGWVKL